MGFGDIVFGAMGGICGMLPYCELIMIGFKIVMLMFIISWVRERMGGGTFTTLLILILGYLALFQYFYIFGAMTIVYMLLVMGVTGIIQDLAFGGVHYGVGAEGGNQELNAMQMKMMK